MIELRHLRHFIAVAEELNFRPAAERVHIEPLLAMGRDSHHLPILERFAPDAPAPESGTRCSKWPID
jgi:hypothetical protein